MVSESKRSCIVQDGFNVRECKVTHLECHKFRAKNGICVETRTYVCTSFFGRRGRNKVKKYDIELLWCVILRLYRFGFDCADIPPWAVMHRACEGLGVFPPMRNIWLRNAIIVKRDVIELEDLVERRSVLCCASRVNNFLKFLLCTRLKHQVSIVWNISDGRVSNCVKCFDEKYF